MKKFNISLDELDDLLCKLWEWCKSGGCYQVNPGSNRIDVFDGGTRQIAEIKVIAIDDAYDIKEELFKKD